MNELIQQLQQKAGLTHEQATISLETIKQFVVEKFPMLSGAVDNIFPSSTTTATTGVPHSPMPTGMPTGTSVTTPTGTGTTESSFLDKISDYIPGQAGQKIEDFAKKAANGAGDLFNKK